MPDVPPGPGMEWVDDMPLNLLGLENEPMPSDAFINSVRRFGVIQPIIVRLTEDPDEVDEYTVVDGRRRVIAARQLGHVTIPTLVMRDSLNVASAITITANTQRSPNPRAEYEAIDRLVREGFSTEQVAQELQLPIARIERRYAIASLRPDLRALYTQGHISHNTAVAATRLDAEAQNRCVTLFQASGSLTVHDVLMAVEMQSRAQTTIPLIEMNVDQITDQILTLSDDEIERVRRSIGIRDVSPSSEHVRQIENQLTNIRNRYQTLERNLEVRTSERDNQARQVRELQRQLTTREAEFSGPQPMTPAEARDAVQRYLVTRVQFPEGTIVRGRITRSPQSNEWVFTMDVAANDNMIGFDRMMRAVRAMGRPQRQVVRERILEIISTRPEEDWGLVVDHLRQSLGHIPMEHRDADAAYQHIMAALLEVARMSGIAVER